MVNTPQAAVLHGAAYFRNKGRAPAPIGEKEKAVEIKPPQIRHYTVGGTTRPMVTTPPAHPIRVTKAEIEAALGDGFAYHPNQAEVVDRIVPPTPISKARAAPQRRHNDTGRFWIEICPIRHDAVLAGPL